MDQRWEKYVLVFGSDPGTVHDLEMAGDLESADAEKPAAGVGHANEKRAQTAGEQRVRDVAGKPIA